MEGEKGIFEWCLVFMSKISWMWKMNYGCSEDVSCELQPRHAVKSHKIQLFISRRRVNISYFSTTIQQHVYPSTIYYTLKMKYKNDTSTEWTWPWICHLLCPRDMNLLYVRIYDDTQRPKIYRINFKEKINKTSTFDLCLCWRRYAKLPTKYKTKHPFHFLSNLIGSNWNSFCTNNGEWEETKT